MELSGMLSQLPFSTHFPAANCFAIAHVLLCSGVHHVNACLSVPVLTRQPALGRGWRWPREYDVPSRARGPCFSPSKNFPLPFSEHPLPHHSHAWPRHGHLAPKTPVKGVLIPQLSDPASVPVQIPNSRGKGFDWCLRLTCLHGSHGEAGSPRSKSWDMERWPGLKEGGWVGQTPQTTSNPGLGPTGPSADCEQTPRAPSTQLSPPAPILSLARPHQCHLL